MAHDVSGERNTSGGGGPLGGAGDPPNLMEYSNEPQYDLATIVGSVGVRPMILWGWEQQLGIPAPARVTDEMGGSVRRYSERDLVASIWLRDQIVKGVSPGDAAARLQEAQRPVVHDGGAWGGGEVAATYEEPMPFRGRVTTGPLPNSTLPPRQARAYLPATEGTSGSQNAGTNPDSPSSSGSLSQQGGYGPGLGRAQVSGSLPRNSYGPALAPPQTGNLYAGYATSSSVWVNPVSGPLRATAGPLSRPLSTSRPLSMSGPLAGPASQSFGGSTPLPTDAAMSDAASVGVPWTGPASTSTRGRELRTLVPQLVRAFLHYDTLAANHIVSEALSSRSVETVCMSLFQPALVRIGELWLYREISFPEEHFAVNYVRGVLFTIFHKTPERFDAPMIMIGCGQRELQDTAALMLAVFARRLGLRVVYLGQDVEGDGLLGEIRKRRPALVALDISSTQRIRALARLSKDISQLDPPHPVFGYTGGIFTRTSDLRKKVKGEAQYLGDDTLSATLAIARALGIRRDDM
jgi:methanogenic corrinoid protein MtbC1